MLAKTILCCGKEAIVCSLAIKYFICYNISIKLDLYCCNPWSCEGNAAYKSGRKQTYKALQSIYLIPQLTLKKKTKIPALHPLEAARGPQQKFHFLTIAIAIPI